MRRSELFFKTQKEFPKDEVAANARFLIRANFIEKLMAGVYSFLPLGFRVREKVMGIIREEMDAIGGNEMMMPALHPKSVWEVTGRWEGMSSVMYQFSDKGGREIGLGPTHEEVVAQIAKGLVSSYLDLPILLYQIQAKFRDEERPKSGLLRGREFTMKDLYSFHTDKKSLEEFYESCKEAYLKIFTRCGLKAVVTEASGGDFTKEYSHEFMVEADVGEDEMFLCRLCNFARNTEISNYKKKEACPQCKEGVLERVNSIEVGNIFKLGTKFSEPVGLSYCDAGGKSKPVVMGSYGIGVERLIGTIVEVYHDQNGILWPESVAPFRVHLLSIGEVTDELRGVADKLYGQLSEAGIEVLYDDREDVAAGEKFFDSDLVGIPWRVVVSGKTLAHGKAELKGRDSEEVELIKTDKLLERLKV